MDKSLQLNSKKNTENYSEKNKTEVCVSKPQMLDGLGQVSLPERFDSIMKQLQAMNSELMKQRSTLYSMDKNLSVIERTLGVPRFHQPFRQPKLLRRSIRKHKARNSTNKFIWETNDSNGFQDIDVEIHLENRAKYSIKNSVYKMLMYGKRD